MNRVSAIETLLPGVAVTAICGLAALFLSEHYAAPVMLLSLLIGMALAFLYEETKCQAGIDFVARHALRFGVALIGLRIAFNDVIALGWQTIFILIVAVVSTILIGLVLARLSGMSNQFGALTGGAVAICGASAALAISSVLPDGKEKERYTVLTVIGVTVLSTICMVLYPIIASVLGFDYMQTSIFLGGTIHDVAQVVGAGYSVSEQTGDVATLIKLVRVSLLVPVVLIMLMLFGRKQRAANGAPLLPRFLLVFIALVVLNSLLQVPTAITNSAAEVSRFLLVLAIAAIGMKSNLRQLLEVGFKPVAIMLLETFWIAGFIIVSLLLFSS